MMINSGLNDKEKNRDTNERTNDKKQSNSNPNGKQSNIRRSNIRRDVLEFRYPGPAVFFGLADVHETIDRRITTGNMCNFS